MDDLNINFLGDMQRIETKPGDLMVLTTEKIISAKDVERIKRAWEAVSPDTKLVILSDGLKLGVVGAE